MNDSQPAASAHAAHDAPGYYEVQTDAGPRLVMEPALSAMGTPAHVGRFEAFAIADGKRQLLMGDDPRLPKMPDKPTLLDFFRRRLAAPAVAHLLQSAALARKAGHDEKIVLACLLHDIAIGGLFHGDHGYWGAQLIEPYVDEEVSWAVRYHQAVRFYADEAVGYQYPEQYRRLFGPDYTPPEYIQTAYRYARGHKWYMDARLIALNDLYSFDPNVTVDPEDFADIIGRNFRQPAEGLGFDNSSVAHMWRAMIWPHNGL
jgi:hypothetical protein